MTSLSLFDWSICVGYLVVVFAMGVWFARQQQTQDDYFVGGRRMHWLPIGLSLFAGTFSSLSFVGLPSEAAYVDYHLYLAILFIPLVVTPIVWLLFIPLYFRLGVTSPYEYVERRFNRSLRLLASLLFMLYTIGWMGNLLRAVGVILQAVLDLSQSQTAWLLVGVGVFATLYTSLGGVKAVVWTDALQAFALGGGMLLVLLLAVAKVDGGWAAVWEVGRRHDKFAMFHSDFDLQNANVYGACAFGLFVYVAGHSVVFTAVQRYVSMPSVAAAGRSLMVNGVMVAAVCLVFFLAGSTVFAFYHQEVAEKEGSDPFLQQSHQGDGRGGSTGQDGGRSVAGAERGGNLWQELRFDEAKEQRGEPNRQDQLLPRFIMQELPVKGLMGLLLAGLFAAAMSSVDSGINSMTATVVCDWRRDGHWQLSQSRMLCGLFGLAAVAMALVFYFAGGRVFPLIMKIAGMFFGLLFGMFLLGLFVRRAGSTAAAIGLAAGVTCLSLPLVWDISHWWYGAITSIPTFAVGCLASFVLPRPPEGKVRGLAL